MPIYTFSVAATFNFDISAPSREEAERIAREKLRAHDPIDDSHGGTDPAYPAPWIAVAGADTDFPSLEITDES